MELNSRHGTKQPFLCSWFPSGHFFCAVQPWASLILPALSWVCDPQLQMQDLFGFLLFPGPSLCTFFFQSAEMNLRLISLPQSS
jgi:hypothetical protein